MQKPFILFDNRFSAATVASATAAGDFAAENVADFRVYTWWQPPALPATLTNDCGAAMPADTLAVFGHDFGTQGTTLEVRGSTDGFVASDVLVASIAPTGDAPFFLSFAQASFRHWRLALDGATVPSLACVVLGVRMTLPNWLGSGFDYCGRRTDGQRNVSEAGLPIGRVIWGETWKQRLVFNDVSWDWLRTVWEPAWESHLRSSPFVFAWAPDLYPDEIRLVMAGDDYDAPQRAGGFANLTFDVFGAA